MPSQDPAFRQRLQSLPHLGIGISTEYAASLGGLDPQALLERSPDLLDFLEIGVDLERGIDASTRAWIQAGHPITYHFLDVNLEESESLDGGWGERTGELARELGAVWLCGDAGLWHVGPRDHGHGVLMPPILTTDSALAMAQNLSRLRRESRFEVLPENPPAHVYLGDLHLLDYFAQVVSQADSGMLLDLAHLVIYQECMGCELLEGLDRFPLDRVLELHIAGGSRFDHLGRAFIDDDHCAQPLPETWELLEYVLPRAPALRAIVYECERNPLESVLPGFGQLRARTRELAGW